MEIIVEGKGMTTVVPDQVIINFDFITKGETYEEVLELGSRNVYDFIQNIIVSNGFNSDDLKTRSFVIREERKYDEITRQYLFDGYSYNQHGTIKFDYDKELLARFMDALSKIANPPKSYINFGIKDEKLSRNKLLELAYEDAKSQAAAIAHAAGKELKCCSKVDFKPFTTSYVSMSNLDGNMFCADEACFGRGAAEVITNIFTPEDITLSETLYCLWIAE